MTHPWPGIEDDSPIKELAAPVIPEPPRNGEGGTECGACLDDVPEERQVYRDALFRVHAIKGFAMAGSLMVVSHRHVDGLTGLNAEEQAAFGPLLARLSKVLEERPAGAPGFGDGRVGRVHVHLWNDGGAHFHAWLVPRPLGYLDMRGSYLVEWAEGLPPATDEEVVAAAADVRSRLTG